MRGLWAERANEALARAGEEARIDHRSHAERGLEILPTVHEGPTARAMAERDKIVERVQLNRDVKAANAELLDWRKSAVRWRRPSSGCWPNITSISRRMVRRDYTRDCNKVLCRPAVFCRNAGMRNIDFE